MGRSGTAATRWRRMQKTVKLGVELGQLVQLGRIVFTARLVQRQRGVCIVKRSGSRSDANGALGDLCDERIRHRR